MHRRLPPLIALRVFDAAARRLSFSQAADDLNVTQGAVSRQIKLLEGFLGKQLFRRLTRRVELTPFGEAYFTSTSNALDEIEQATGEALGTKNYLSVSILPTTATLWLFNHLSTFMREYPNIHIRVSTSMDPVDFRQQGFDAAIRVGKLPGKQYGHHQPQIDYKMVTDWKGVVAIRLWDDLITPVCSKKLLAKGPLLKTPIDLQTYRLIHHSVRRDC
ncbi:MAG: LysR family transcriptional regulator, partial [Sphingobium sp.]